MGQEVGPTEWREVTQEDINTFADLSGDDQWIHVDVERAKTESPFGTTVAHGNLTLSMIDGLRRDLIESHGFKLGVNYGWNRCAPCAGPGRLEGPAKAEVTEVDEVGGGWCRSSPSSPSRSRVARNRSAWARRRPRAAGVTRWPASRQPGRAGRALRPRGLRRPTGRARVRLESAARASGRHDPPPEARLKGGRTPTAARTPSSRPTRTPGAGSPPPAGGMAEHAAAG